MRRWCYVLALALAVGGAAPAFAQPAQEPQQTQPEDIAALIEQLNSDSYAVRVRARMRLEKLGAEALPALREAAKSDNMEVRQIASEIVSRLEEIERKEKLLTPKLVHLVCQDTPVADAVADLEKQSGYRIPVLGDRTRLQKKITLDTGRTTFWQAFDQLCLAAGLVEAEQPPAGQNPAVPLPVDNLPIRIQPALPIRAVPLPAQRLPAQIQPANPAPLQIKQAQEAAAAAKAQAEAARKQAEEMLQRQQKQAEEQQQQLQKLKQRLQRQRNANAGALQVQVRGVQAQGGIQIQVAPAAQPVQAVPVPIATTRPAPVPENQANSGTIPVRPGEPQQVPTCYAGAVRIQAVPGPKSKNGEVSVTFRVSVEPRITSFTLTDLPVIQKAVDEHGQELRRVTDESANPADPNAAQLRLLARGYYVPNQPSLGTAATVRLTGGEKQSGTLKELSGRLIARMVTPTEALVTVTDVLKSAGKTVQGKSGGSMQVQAIEKQNNGQVRVTVSIDYPPAMNGGGPAGIGIAGGGVIQINGNVVINGRVIGNNNAMPELLDAKGVAFRLAQVPSRGLRVVNNQVSQQFVLVYSPVEDGQEPAALELRGQNLTDLDIPFRFEDVPVR